MIDVVKQAKQKEALVFFHPKSRINSE